MTERHHHHPSLASSFGTIAELAKMGAPIALVDSAAPFIRFALVVAYDGEPFHGLAADPQQPNTIQAHLQHKLACMVGRKSPETCQVTLHGRTDAGVHSQGTVVHVDLTRNEVEKMAARRTSSSQSTETIPMQAAAVLQQTLLRGLGSGHTKYIQVRAVHPVSRDYFHARKSSVSKVYSYRIHSGYALPWETRRCWCLYGRHLDIDSMRQVAASLIGIHDCSVFCRDKRKREDF